MPMWGTVLVILFSGLTTVAVLITLFRSFRFATKDDIDRLEKRIDQINANLDQKIENLNQRIDRHLEGHQ